MLLPGCTAVTPSFFSDFFFFKWPFHRFNIAYMTNWEGYNSYKSKTTSQFYRCKQAFSVNQNAATKWIELCSCLITLICYFCEDHYFSKIMIPFCVKLLLVVVLCCGSSLAYHMLLWKDKSRKSTPPWPYMERLYERKQPIVTHFCLYILVWCWWCAIGCAVNLHSPDDMEMCSLKVLQPDGSPSRMLLRLMGERGCTTGHLTDYLQTLGNSDALQCLKPSGMVKLIKTHFVVIGATCASP